MTAMVVPGPGLLEDGPVPVQKERPVIKLKSEAQSSRLPVCVNKVLLEHPSVYIWSMAVFVSQQHS